MTETQKQELLTYYNDMIQMYLLSEISYLQQGEVNFARNEAVTRIRLMVDRHFLVNDLINPYDVTSL